MMSYLLKDPIKLVQTSCVMVLVTLSPHHMETKKNMLTREAEVLNLVIYRQQVIVNA